MWYACCKLLYNHELPNGGIKMQCNKCGNILQDSDNFCSKCGAKAPEEATLLHVGIFATSSVYRITFTVEDEFGGRSEVDDAIRESCFNDDGEFDRSDVEDLGDGVYKVQLIVERVFHSREAVDEVLEFSFFNGEEELDSPEVVFVKKATSLETHPFMCGDCHIIVSETDNGRCCDCGAKNWIDNEGTEDHE